MGELVRAVIDRDRPVLYVKKSGQIGIFVKAVNKEKGNEGNES